MQQTLEWKNKTKGQASIHLMPGSNRGLGAHLTLQFLRHFFPLECSKQLFPERNAKTGDRARPEIQNKALFAVETLMHVSLLYFHWAFTIHKDGLELLTTNLRRLSTWEKLCN